jgi:hypothetical protein
MKLPRRKFLHLAAGAAALPVVSRITWAQAYPTRPVRIHVTRACTYKSRLSGDCWLIQGGLSSAFRQKLSPLGGHVAPLLRKF